MRASISNNSVMLKNWIDPALPDSISWWPETMIWKVLAVLFITFVMYHLLLKFKKWRALTYQRDAIKALQKINLNAQYNAFQEANNIIKTVLLHAYPRQQVAGLYGNALLHFLDKTAPCLLHATLGEKWQAALILCKGSVLLSDTEMRLLQQQWLLWVSQHNRGKNV